MTDPTSINPHGPVPRAVLAITLTSAHDAVALPEPTMEYGGILPVPVGALVRLDIGHARRCFAWDAAKLAGALHVAAEIEIVGSDIEGITQTRIALAAALERPRPPRTG